jgi:DbpA RNA binding domain
MKDEFSFLEVKTEVAKTIFESFKNQEWEGKRLRIEVAEKREGGSGGGGYKGGGGGGGYKGGNRGGSGGGGNRSRSYGGGGGAKKYSSGSNSGSSSSGGFNKGKSFGKDRGGFGKKKYSASWD